MSSELARLPTSWIRRALSSSLGRKYVMAATGLLLVGFLVIHLAGNVLLYSGDRGAAFDAYAARLEANPLLPVAELGLAAIFLSHVVLALHIHASNRAARNHGYAVRASPRRATFASRSMVFTGLIVLVFIAVHLYDFRVGKLFEEPGGSLWRLVRLKLSSAWHTAPGKMPV